MAYKKAAPWLDHLVGYTEESIAWITNYCQNELPQVKVVKPEGTYQVWLDFRSLGLSNEELDQLIIHKAGVGLTPGYWFGEEGSGYMRMNIGCPIAKIKEAFAEIKAVL
jgi:cystathionine beta-lyase